MDPWILILSLGALQGLFLGAMVGVPRSDRPRPRVYLALLLLALSVHLGESVAFRMGLTAVDERRFYIFFTTPNTFLFGPLFYLFARTLLRGRGKRVWPHFVPAALAAVNYLPAYVLSVTTYSISIEWEPNVSMLISEPSWSTRATIITTASFQSQSASSALDRDTDSRRPAVNARNSR